MNNFGQYLAEVHEELAAHPELRVGQVLFNKALEFPELQEHAEYVRGTMFDPFHSRYWTDSLVIDFIEDIIDGLIEDHLDDYIEDNLDD